MNQYYWNDRVGYLLDNFSGIFVTDDFGNSVKLSLGGARLLSVYILQDHDEV